MPEKNRQAAGGGETDWRLKDIERLIDLLVERKISEFEMEKDGFRIRIRQGGNHTEATAATTTPTVLPVPVPVAAPIQAAATAAALAPAPAASPPDESAAAGEAAEPATESAEGLYIIKSPIVGTFYRSPSPNAEVFVERGDVVRVGQVLCIIEAMKLMNEIQSEVNGEVVRVYVESGQPVEYGQSLFAIKPSRTK